MQHQTSHEHRNEDSLCVCEVLEVVVPVDVQRRSLPPPARQQAACQDGIRTVGRRLGKAAKPTAAASAQSSRKSESPSMMDAWLSSSEKIAQSAESASAPRTERLAA